MEPILNCLCMYFSLYYSNLLCFASLKVICKLKKKKICEDIVMEPMISRDVLPKNVPGVGWGGVGHVGWGGSCRGGCRGGVGWVM